MSSLLELYKAEYSGSGGDPKEVVTYNSQNLLRKFQYRFGDEIRIAHADMRRENYICKASLTDEQAITKLHDDFKEYEENEKIRYAALHLRSQIMKMPKTKTPDPTTVQVQLLLYLRSGFFEILHCGGVRADLGQLQGEVLWACLAGVPHQ
ncbi:hypothetical protein Pcinc_003272 [Petrolisthes cinctipes]|uniref:Uncharacterized protein n=1 Tax=Petrolisthes cinctipes TaxID=88211 RepID=A0AAE1GJ88_PETCI|nr:hypothetical protein Pcinc_003272 [Petrolisthes cinctipes]